MKLPKKIDPCPIAQTILEIRFLTAKPDEAVFGLLYSNLIEKFPDYQSLPITQLPYEVRKKDDNLKFKPYYRFKSDNYLLNLGPRVISLIRQKPYNGWDNFSKDAFDVISELNNANIVDNIVRLGLRYTNFFERDIYSDTNVGLTLSDEDFIKEDTYIKNLYRRKDYKVILQLSNNSTYERNEKKRKGSIIDVDVISDNIDKQFLEGPKEKLNEIHDVEKEVFFNILTEEYINSLNPQY